MIFSLGCENLTQNTIDELDTKIVSSLLPDGRKKFIDIASETNESLDVICQHYRKMEKVGIITGSTIFIDYRVLGYKLNFFVSLSVSSPNKELVIETIRKIPGFYDVYLLGDKSNLIIPMHLENNQKFENVKQLIRNLPCRRMNLEVWTGNRVNMANLSIFSNCGSLRKSDASDRKAKKRNLDGFRIDALDWKIIEQLVYDCRVTFSSLSKKTGNSTSTIIRRFNRLFNSGFILPTIQINTSKLGYPADVLFKLRADTQTDLNETAEKISKIPDIYGIFKTVGDCDFILFGCLKNLEHILKLEEQINEITNIQEIVNISILPSIPSGLPVVAMQKSTF